MDIPAPTPKLETTGPAIPDDFVRLEKKYAGPETLAVKLERGLDKLRSVPVEEKIFFTQNLGVMLGSGLAIARALRTLTLQTTNRRFKRVLFAIYRQVEKGEKIAAAMRPYPKIFPPIFASMIKTGEEAGQLEEVLAKLTEQMKKSHELKQKVKGALMYPAAILFAMTGIGAGMLVFVVPKLVNVFEEMNVTLPLPTRILIAFSRAINEHLLILVAALLPTVLALAYFFTTAPGKKFLSWLALHLPIIKRIVIKINLAKIARTLSSLLATDIPIVSSLKLTSETVGNTVYRASLLAIAASVEKGQTISSEMLAFKKIYPPVAQQMVAVGEETAEISKILNQLAAFYEEDISQTMTNLPSIIEPILIVILGGAVGGMAVAIIMPMYTLTQAV